MSTRLWDGEEGAQSTAGEKREGRAEVGPRRERVGGEGEMEWASNWWEAERGRDGPEMAQGEGGIFILLVLF